MVVKNLSGDDVHSEETEQGMQGCFITDGLRDGTPINIHQSTGWHNVNYNNNQVRSYFFQSSEPGNTSQKSKYEF